MAPFAWMISEQGAWESGIARELTPKRPWRLSPGQEASGGELEGTEGTPSFHEEKEAPATLSCSGDRVATGPSVFIA